LSVSTRDCFFSWVAEPLTNHERMPKGKGLDPNIQRRPIVSTAPLLRRGRPAMLFTMGYPTWLALLGPGEGALGHLLRTACRAPRSEALTRPLARAEAESRPGASRTAMEGRSRSDGAPGAGGLAGVVAQLFASQGRGADPGTAADRGDPGGPSQAYALPGSRSDRTTKTGRYATRRYI